MDEVPQDATDQDAPVEQVSGDDVTAEEADVNVQEPAVSARESLGQTASQRQAPNAVEQLQETGAHGAAEAPLPAAPTADGAMGDVQKDAEKIEPESTEPQDAGQQTEDPEENCRGKTQVVCAEERAPHNVTKTVELATNNDRGDVADWGRTGEQSPVELSSNGEDNKSMSSGMSPRDREWSPEGRGGPRSRPFGPSEGLASLVHHTKTYMASQQLRKKGQAPASMGLADDLATRLAYESLSSLSGMASKVQETIEHNRKAFANQVALIDKQTLQKAMYAWKLWNTGKKDRKSKLRRAMNRITRGCLSRAFYRWREKLAQEEKSRIQRKKVQVTISKGLLSRCFFEWRRLADDRWWKKQLLFREREIELLEKLCGGFRNRPFVVLRKRRLRKKRRAKRAQLNKMVRRMKYVRLGHSWRAWARKVAASKEKRPKLYRAAVLMMRTRAAKAFRSWVHFVDRRLEKRNIIQRWQKPVKGRAFGTWVEFVEWRRGMRALLRKAVPRMQNVAVAGAFRTWKQSTERSKREHLADTVGDNTTQIAALKAENDRLRRDNERFVRIIDSGEWGRGRVAELVQAGQVLKSERDQLAQLMAHLRQDYEAVERAKVAQQEELAALKERMKKKGAANNKMLVKGGSSFNALMRAMKQQVIDTNTGERDPNLLFEINKMSMNKLQVFPDGELDVQALADASNTTASVRASGAVRTMHGRGSAAAQAPGALPRSHSGSGNNWGTAAGRPPSGSMRRPLGGATAQDVARALYSLSPAEMQQLQAGINEQGASRTLSGGNPVSPRPAFS